eukprot:TRINITY_DN203_c0_g1_i1.p1 TRINITY_DN203_c0_g1~~TRINITY_DN203_c0_g1_i1.p1  ORF type:complete len:178 (-),score=46.51 TRINITY_DN203_c0_g1_i1:289-822(-)
MFRAFTRLSRPAANRFVGGFRRFATEQKAGGSGSMTKTQKTYIFTRIATPTEILVEAKAETVGFLSASDGLCVYGPGSVPCVVEIAPGPLFVKMPAGHPSHRLFCSAGYGIIDPETDDFNITVAEAIPDSQIDFKEAKVFVDKLKEKASKGTERDKTELQVAENFLSVMVGLKDFKF